MKQRFGGSNGSVVAMLARLRAGFQIARMERDSASADRDGDARVSRWIASHPPVVVAGGWITVALVVVIFIVSSAVPFIRVGSDGARLDGSDVRQVLLLVVTWIPFVVTLTWYVRATSNVRGVAAALAVVGHIALFCLASYGHAYVFLVVQRVFEGATPVWDVAVPAVQLISLISALQYLVIVAVLFAVAAGTNAHRIRERAALLEVEQAQLERQLTDARLDLVRSKLHPHFLFNTLNSISVLALDDPHAARRMIMRLSELLRAVLTDVDRPTIRLSDEIELLRAYLDIQRIRFREQLQVDLSMDPATSDCLVPPLLLQPLAENAIAHAIANRDTPGEVFIRSTVRDGRLTLTVGDDGRGDASDQYRGHDGHGVGLRSTRERLAATFGANHSFALEPNDRGGITARVELPAVRSA